MVSNPLAIPLGVLRDEKSVICARNIADSLFSSLTQTMHDLSNSSPREKKLHVYLSSCSACVVLIAFEEISLCPQATSLMTILV